MAWPASLPRPRAAGFSHAPGSQARRFEPDEGPPTQRRVTTARYDQMTLSFRLTAAQHATLMDFWRGEGAGGGAWFEFTNPLTGAVLQARFVAGKEPQTSAAPPWFETIVTLEVAA